MPVVSKIKRLGYTYMAEAICYEVNNAFASSTGELNHHLAQSPQAISVAVDRRTLNVTF